MGNGVSTNESNLVIVGPGPQQEQQDQREQQEVEAQQQSPNKALSCVVEIRERSDESPVYVKASISSAGVTFRNTSQNEPSWGMPTPATKARYADIKYCGHTPYPHNESTRSRMSNRSMMDASTTAMSSVRSSDGPEVDSVEKSHASVISPIQELALPKTQERDSRKNALPEGTEVRRLDLDITPVKQPKKTMKKRVNFRNITNENSSNAVQAY